MIDILKSYELRFSERLMQKGFQKFPMRSLQEGTIPLWRQPHRNRRHKATGLNTNLSKKSHVLVQNTYNDNCGPLCFRDSHDWLCSGRRENEVARGNLYRQVGANWGWWRGKKWEGHVVAITESKQIYFDELTGERWAGSAVNMMDINLTAESCFY